MRREGKTMDASDILEHIAREIFGRTPEPLTPADLSWILDRLREASHDA